MEQYALKQLQTFQCYDNVIQVLNHLQWHTGSFFKKTMLPFFEGLRRWEIYFTLNTAEVSIRVQWRLHLATGHGNVFNFILVFIKAAMYLLSDAYGSIINLEKGDIKRDQSLHPMVHLSVTKGLMSFAHINANYGTWCLPQNGSPYHCGQLQPERILMNFSRERKRVKDDSWDIKFSIDLAFRLWAPCSRLGTLLHWPCVKGLPQIPALCRSWRAVLVKPKSQTCWFSSAVIFLGRSFVEVGDSPVNCLSINACIIQLTGTNVLSWCSLSVFAMCCHVFETHKTILQFLWLIDLQFATPTLYSLASS